MFSQLKNTSNTRKSNENPWNHPDCQVDIQVLIDHHCTDSQPVCPRRNFLVQLGSFGDAVRWDVTLLPEPGSFEERSPGIPTMLILPGNTKLWISNQWISLEFNQFFESNSRECLLNMFWSPLPHGPRARKGNLMWRICDAMVQHNFGASNQWTPLEPRH